MWSEEEKREEESKKNQINYHIEACRHRHVCQSRLADGGGSHTSLPSFSLWQPSSQVLQT